MLIDITTISRSTGASLTIEAEISPKELALAFQGKVFDQPLFFSGMLQNTGKGVFSLTGAFRTRYSTDCARCLGPASINIEAPLSEQFLSGQAAAEQGPGSEGYRYSSHAIDIGQALRDNLVLALPQRLLCREDCPGICPECGKNLNEGTCGCADKPTGKASPFDSLKQLL
jgi:uncharacterized protein